MINALYLPYSLVCLLCQQRALEESRWRELEQTRERSARLLYGDKPYSQSAQRLTAFNAVTMATWTAVAGAHPDLCCSVLRPGFFQEQSVLCQFEHSFVTELSKSDRKKKKQNQWKMNGTLGSKLWTDFLLNPIQFLFVGSVSCLSVPTKILLVYCLSVPTKILLVCVLFIRANKDTVGVCYHILLQKNMCTREYIHGTNQLTHGYVCVRKQRRCTHSNSLCWLPFYYETNSCYDKDS